MLTLVGALSLGAQSDGCGVGRGGLCGGGGEGNQGRQSEEVELHDGYFNFTGTGLVVYGEFNSGGSDWTIPRTSD